MKKKVLSMLVTFAMLLSMFPATAFAADYNVTANGNDLDDAESQEYYKFDEVANTATADDKIIIKEDMTYTLTEDTTLSAPLVVDGHSFTLNLGGKTLTVDGDNKFSNDANVTIKNGTLSITGATASGDAIFCVGNYSTNATLTLEDVDVTGDGYSSAYAVFCIYGKSTLNINGGSVIVSDDNSSAGGVFKAEDALNGKINIIGTVSDPVELTFDDAKIGFLDGTVVMDYVDLDITGGANAINQSALTVKNSSLTISGADGRALTLKDGDVTVENSTLDFSDCSEGEIRFKAGVSLTVDENSSIAACTTYADSADTGANINEEVVTGTEAEPDSVTVENGVTTIKATPKGTVTPAYTKEVDGYVRVWGEGGGNAKESLELKLYAGETLIATTKLNNVEGVINGDVTWNFYYPNSNASHWTTTWEEGHPNSVAQPTKVELYIDGVMVAENVAKMSAPDDLNPVVWRELGGVEQADLVETNGEYTINNLKELQIFRNTVNAGNTYQGKTVRLTADIDLNNEEWTPIGNSTNIFKGTFDGGNHTISNLVVNMAGKSNVGLFGMTTDGEVKNLNINNAIVTGRLNVGVVAGTPYTSKYTNIKVTGHVEVNGMAYVGGVGGKNAYANWTDITVDVDDTSYVKATSTESGTAYRTYVGGVVGFNGEGSHTFKNISSNIDVIGDVCDVGGVFGIAHYSNKFENIACSGDVINSNSSDPLEETETGGICGVWHNQAGTSVSFDDCEFTGTVTVNGVVVTSNNLTGGAYNPNNDESSTSGSLIVDGEKQWPLVAEVNGVQYGTMSAAIAAAGADDVVTLLNDAVEVVEINNGGTTVDLGGHTLSGSILIKDGEFEIKNGSIVNSDASVSGIEINAGALTLTDVNVTSARHALRVDGSATVTVDGGEYIVSESAGKTTHAVNVSGGGSVTIKDGAFTGPRGMANDSGAAVTVQADSTVIITGGSFSGGKNNTLSSKGSLIVAGGAFDQNPSAYLATGYYSYQSQSNSMYYVNLDDGFDAVAETNGVKHQTLEAAVNAAKDGGTVVILKGGNYSVPTGKNLTITGAVEDVKFDMSQAVNMSGASVTFNNVTFEYGSSNYVGLQHAGTMVYNDCTINGQVFLYGTSETFNDCTFNQSSADAYNVWTYGAQIVNFNDCEFNSAGKSVLVYNEGACATDLTVVKTKFIASAPVEGKAAIEIDTTLMPDGTDIVIDAATTATGFDKGSISGEELWNDKKDQTDLTVTVGEEQVWPIAVAQIGDQKFYSLQDAVNAAVENETVTITLLTDTSEAARIDIGSKKDITIVGQVNGEGEYPAFTGWFKVTGKLTLKDVTLVAPSTAVPGETTSQYTKTVIGLMNTGDVVCENVTFDMSNAVTDSTAITAWWSTGDGANITVTGCTFDCAGQRPIRSDACVTVEGCTFNDPYRYAVQMTSKSSTMAADAEAYVVFNNNTIVDGENGKEYVYGVQLEGGYGCSDLTITGTGNTITADENDGSTLYFVENTDNMGFETIQWKTETAPVLDQSTFAAKIAGTDGDIYLPTLAEAIGIVAADGTVTLVANSTEEIAINKALTIELNGFTAEKVTPADGYAVVKYETKWVFGAADSVVPVTGVTLSGATSVNVGNTITLTATVAPDNATDKTVTWTSSNESVATVADGVVTGVAAGTATITVTTADGGFTADCTVTVSRASSGGGGGGSYNPSYTITAEDTENGSITVSPSRASSGSTVTITVDPDSGYELDELTVLDKNGKEVKLTKKSDSKYTFKMPSGKVTVEATFAEIEAFENPFTDVAEGAYYYDAVLWAAENGITGGTSATTFSPAVTCTRAQTVTFLWRAAGSPDPEGTNMPFTDVASDAYYYDAVLWAVENGITSGTSATTFSPNATVTRAQNVTFLWRWAESSAVEAVNPFTDVAADIYYHDAVLWAADEGITAGTSATTFSPDDPCLRSQIVTFLYRYLVK